MKVSVARLAALAAAVGVLCCAAAPAQAARQPPSGGAFVRVNQVGYPTTASKRAYLMASADAETGATFAVRAAPRTVFSAPVGAQLGSWSTAYPATSTRSTSLGHDRRHLHDHRSPGRSRRPRRASRSAPAATSTRQALDERARLLPGRSATAPTTSRPRSARRPAHLNDAARHDLPDAERQLVGPLLRRSQPARRDRSTRRAAGGTPATTSSSCRPTSYTTTCCSPACATSRPRWAPAQRRPTSPPRRSSGPTGCCACGTTRPARSTTRSASAAGTRRRSATTTSGGCRRPTTPIGGTDPRLPLHPQPAGVPRRRRRAR